jgi:transposase InsO family protein
MRTFKEDEVYIRDYATFDDAHRSIARFLDVTYNDRRLHSSIGYLPPAEFEAAQIEPTVHPTPA